MLRFVDISGWVDEFLQGRMSQVCGLLCLEVRRRGVEARGFGAWDAASSYSTVRSTVKYKVARKQLVSMVWFKGRFFAWEFDRAFS